MKKILLQSVIMFSLFFAFQAYGAQGNVGPNGIHEPGTGLENQNQGDVSSTVENKNQQDQKEFSSSTIRDMHRSAVANFVSNLLEVANRDGGIGQQVRFMAHEQDQSASTTVQAMEKVQNRGGLRTFFFGSDYKNLGVIRSEMVKTQNRLEQLTKLVADVQNAGDKTVIENQINVLEQEKSKIENFVNTNENKFSLFGWFAKMFNK